MVKEVIELAIGLIRIQEWYGLAVLLLPLFVQLLKAPGLWKKVPVRLQPFVPVVIAAVAGLSDAMVSGVAFGEALWQALSAGLVVGVGAIGIYETAWRMRHGAKAELLALLLVVGTGWATSGCAASLESARSARPALTGASPRDSARCRSLDDRRTTWGAITTGAVVLGGGSGLGSIPARSREAELGLKAGAAGAAVVAGVAHYVEQRATEAWTRECSQ